MSISNIIAAWELGSTEWLVLALTGILIGLNKSGLRGVSIIVIPLLAASFGSRASAGILLPILITGDLFAVVWYRNSVDWRRLLALIPWAAAGVILGTVFGSRVPEDIFQIVLGSLLIIVLVLMTIFELRGNINPPRAWYYAALIGSVAGFATMVGNAAGPIMAIYLLATKLPKKHFIGTGALFAIIINVFKVPFHVVAWKTITLNTLVLDALAAPLVIISFFLGLKIVGIIPEKPFRWFVIIATLAGVIKLFF